MNDHSSDESFGKRAAKARPAEPQQGPTLSPEEIARRSDEHMTFLNAEHDRIGAVIRERLGRGRR